MILTDEDIERLKAVIVYSRHDMGEVGTFVRVSYALEFIDQMVKQAKSRA